MGDAALPVKRKPAYLLHKPTGQARVRFHKRDIYLGKYGSPESRDRYDEVLAEWFAENNCDSVTLTIDESADRTRTLGQRRPSSRCR
jgi:hypothetical protein